MSTELAPARGGEQHAAAWIVCAGLFLAAAGLRLFGIGFLLPHYPEPDGVVLATQVELLESGDPHPERDFNFGFYPLLLARLAALVHEDDASVQRDRHPRTVDEHLARASSIHLSIRAVVAILSALAAPATWLLARRFLSPGAALVAAILVGASFLNVWFAQQARPHAAAASFAPIGVLCALELRRRGTWREFLACGLALAFAVGSLQSGLALVLPILAALFLRSGDARQRSWAWIAIPLVLFAIAVLVFYPFMFAESQGKDAAQLGTRGALFNLSGHLINLHLFNGDGFANVSEALVRYEPWLTALAAAGLVLAIVRWWTCTHTPRASFDPERARDLTVLLAYALPYLAVIGLYARTYQRFVLPLVPFLALLAAYACERTWRALAQRNANERARTWMAIAVALLFLLPELAASIHLVLIRSRADTATLAAEWVTAHLHPRAERVALLPGLDLPLARMRETLDADKLREDVRGWLWSRYQRTASPPVAPESAFDLATMPLDVVADRARIKADPRAYLDELACDYAIVEVYDFKRRPLPARIRIALAENFDLVERLSPDRDEHGSNLPLAFQDDDVRTGNDAWFVRALCAVRTGPVIEIYARRR